MRYVVEVTEKWTGVVYVEAENVAEARELAIDEVLEGNADWNSSQVDVVEVENEPA